MKRLLAVVAIAAAVVAFILRKKKSRPDTEQQGDSTE